MRPGVHAIERGKVIGRHTMVAFGGGAPLHAGRLARKLGIDRVVIPTGAGVGSAIGFLLAPIAYEVVRTLQVDFRDFDASAINTMLDEMQAEATDVVRGGALSDAALIATRIVELRYAGQGHDLRIGLDDGPLTRDHGAALKAQFRSAVPERLRAHDRWSRHPQRLLGGDRFDRGSTGFAGADAGGPALAAIARPRVPAHP